MSKPPSRKPEAASGWRIRSARTIHDNRWMRIRDYDAIAPTGAPARYTILSPKNLAIGVLPLFDDGSVPLIGQDRFTTARYSWELPEGGGPLDVDPLASAKRELAEEAQHRADHWRELMRGELSNSITDERLVAFYCWDLSPETAFAPDAVENLTVKRVSFGALLKMSDDGEISDAFTLMMVYKLVHLARSGLLEPAPEALLRRGGLQF